MDEPKNDLIRKNRITALLIGFGTTLLLVVGAYLSLKMLPEHAGLLIISLIVVLNALVYFVGKAIKGKRNKI